MTPRRKLILAFFGLGILSRRDSAMEAGVWDEATEDLDSEERWASVFARADKDSRMMALWDAVARRDKGLSEQENPFRMEQALLEEVSSGIIVAKPPVGQPRPERAFVVDIRAEGDTLEDMICIMEEFLEAARKGGSGGCIGGCTNSGHYNVRRNDITHEGYVGSLKAYLAEN